MLILKKIQVLSLVLCLFALTYCSGGSGDVAPTSGGGGNGQIAGDLGAPGDNDNTGNNAGAAPNNAPPTVVSTNPANGQTLSTPPATIKLEFSTAMDQNSVKKSFHLNREIFGFAGAGASTEVLVGDPVVTDDGKTFEFPLPATVSRSNFRITVGIEAKDASQNPLEQEFSSIFRVADPDEDDQAGPPRVVSINPANNSDDVSRHSSILVIFDQPMLVPTVLSRLTLSELSVKAGINNVTEEEVGGSVQACSDKKSFVFTPDRTLKRTERYRVRVQSDVQNADGINLGQEVTSDFKTRASYFVGVSLGCP